MLASRDIAQRREGTEADLGCMLAIQHPWTAPCVSVAPRKHVPVAMIQGRPLSCGACLCHRVLGCSLPHLLRVRTGTYTVPHQKAFCATLCTKVHVHCGVRYRTRADCTFVKMYPPSLKCTSSCRPSSRKASCHALTYYRCTDVHVSAYRPFGTTILAAYGHGKLPLLHCLSGTSTAGADSSTSVIECMR